MNRLTVKLIASHVAVLAVGFALGLWAATSPAHEHGHEEASTWEEYTNLLTDPAHFFYEMTLNIGVDVLLIGLLIPVVTRAIRKHDERHHEGHTVD